MSNARAIETALDLDLNERFGRQNRRTLCIRNSIVFAQGAQAAAFQLGLRADYKSPVRHGVRWRKSLTPNRLTVRWLEVHRTSTPADLLKNVIGLATINHIVSQTAHSILSRTLNTGRPFVRSRQ